MKYLVLLFLISCGAADEHRKDTFCTQEYCVTPGRIPVIPSTIELALVHTLNHFQEVEASRGLVFSRKEIVDDLRSNPLKIRFVEEYIHEYGCPETGCAGFTIGRNDIRVVIRNSLEIDCMTVSYLMHEILHALLWRFDLQANLNPDQVGLAVSPRGMMKHASAFFYDEGSAELLAHAEVESMLCQFE